MRYIPVAAVLCLALAPSFSWAKGVDRQKSALDRQMMNLEFGTRVEQRCDTRAGADVSRQHPGFKVDKVIAYAFSQSVVNGTEISAPGAIVRSKGKWYRLSFKCKTTPDGLEIESFQHSLGAEVPGWGMERLGE